MSKYLFETDKAGFYEHGIDLLRNGYVYSKIEYREVSGARFKKGHIVKNWGFVFLFGLALVFSAVYVILPSVNKFLETKDFSVFLFWRSPKTFGILVVIFLLAFGIYSLVTAFRYAMILKLYTGNKMTYFSLEKLEKEGKVTDLINFLKERVAVT